MIYKLVSKDIVNKPREVYACIIYELIKRENNIYTFHIHELKTVLPYFELMFYLIYTLLSKTCGMCLSLFFFSFFSFLFHVGIYFCQVWMRRWLKGVS